MNRYMFNRDYKFISNRPSGLIQTFSEFGPNYLFFEDGIETKQVSIIRRPKKSWSVHIWDFKNHQYYCREKDLTWINTPGAIAEKSKFKKIGDEMWVYHPYSRVIYSHIGGNKYKLKSRIDIDHKEYLYE